MKTYFGIFVGLFLVMFTALECCAAGSAEKLEPSGRLKDGIRIIEVKALKYRFEPDPIVVKLGEKVRLVVTSADVAHGLAISEFKINLTVGTGKTESLEFVADKKGTFRTYCTVYCGQGHAQMYASFIVK